MGRASVMLEAMSDDEQTQANPDERDADAETEQQSTEAADGADSEESATADINADNAGETGAVSSNDTAATDDSVVADDSSHDAVADASSIADDSQASDGPEDADNSEDSDNADDLSNTADSSNADDSAESHDSNASQSPSAEGDTQSSPDEALTDSYERLRHSTDSKELSEFAHRPLPDRSEQAAFSRMTALLEAVAGNVHTPQEDRIFLGETMPFPNILVKLSEDDAAEVRCAVAGNKDDKNWLVGRLTKDADAKVRETALHNPQTSWKMRLEGAQNPEISAETLDFLGRMGVESDQDASGVLTAMVRRAVASNPSTSQQTLERLASDEVPEVAAIATKRLA